MKTCNYDWSCVEYTALWVGIFRQISTNWLVMQSLSSLGFIWLLWVCVCNNSLKYHREIIRPRYNDGHYRSTTCITSPWLVSQNGCWGKSKKIKKRDALSTIHVCICVHALLISAYSCSVNPALFAQSFLKLCTRCLQALYVHVEWHFRKMCQPERERKKTSDS